MKRVLTILGLVVLVLASNGIGYTVDDVNTKQGETDYQKGVQEGLWTGLKMGQLLGLAQSGNLTAAYEYNSLVDKYNDGLIKIFGDDPGMKAVFELPKINSSYIKELKGLGYTGEEISKLLC